MSRRLILVLVVLLAACGVELLPTTGGSPYRPNTVGSAGQGGGGGGGITFSVHLSDAGGACSNTLNCIGSLWCSTESSTCVECGSGQTCETDGRCIARSCSHGTVGEACLSGDDCTTGLPCDGGVCMVCPVYSVSVTTDGGVTWTCTSGANGEPCNQANQCDSGMCDGDGGASLCR